MLLFGAKEILVRISLLNNYLAMDDMLEPKILGALQMFMVTRGNTCYYNARTLDASELINYHLPTSYMTRSWPFC